jgi:hypothetical protein
MRLHYERSPKLLHVAQGITHIIGAVRRFLGIVENGRVPQNIYQFNDACLDVLRVPRMLCAGGWRDLL